MSQSKFSPPGTRPPPTVCDVFVLFGLGGARLEFEKVGITSEEKFHEMCEAVGATTLRTCYDNPDAVMVARLGPTGVVTALLMGVVTSTKPRKRSGGARPGALLNFEMRFFKVQDEARDWIMLTRLADHLVYRAMSLLEAPDQNDFQIMINYPSTGHW